MTVKYITKISDCKNAANVLRACDEIAFDIEGVNHGRHGRLSLIQACGRNTDIYLFHITALGKAAFGEGGLKTLLEGSTIKVVFDPRNDADALHYLYGVSLKNAYDLQIMHAFKFSLFSDRFVKGLGKAFQDFTGVTKKERERLDAIKEKGLDLFAVERGGRGEVWEDEPLPKELIDYASCDVKYLLDMKQAWGGRRYDATVLKTTAERIKKAIKRRVALEGRERAKRDFFIPESMGKTPAVRRSYNNFSCR